MPSLKIKTKDFRRFLSSIKRWRKKDFKDDVGRASKRITQTYKLQMKAGLNGMGKSMANVKDVTMNMPIRVSSDPAIRKEVRSSRTPLYARGHAASSIKSTKKVNSYEIEPNTPHGKIVIGYNALTAPVKRDVLVVGPIQEKIIRDEVLSGLDKAIKR